MFASRSDLLIGRNTLLLFLSCASFSEIHFFQLFALIALKSIWAKSQKLCSLISCLGAWVHVHVSLTRHWDLKKRYTLQTKNYFYNWSQLYDFLFALLQAEPLQKKRFFLEERILLFQMLINKGRKNFDGVYLFSLSSVRHEYKKKKTHIFILLND